MSDLAAGLAAGLPAFEGTIGGTIGGIVATGAGYLYNHLWDTSYAPNHPQRIPYRPGGGGPGGGDPMPPPILGHNSTRFNPKRSLLSIPQMVGRTSVRRTTFRRRNKSGKRKGTGKRKTGRKYFTLTRTIVGNVAIPAQDTYVSSANYWTLNQCTSYDTACALYDEYRIKSVTCMFMFDKNTGAINPTGTEDCGTYPFYLCADYDDATAPTTPSNLLQKPSTRIYTAFDGSRFGIKVKPRPRGLAVTTGVTTVGTVGDAKKWLPTLSTDIRHYGMKWFLDMTAQTHPEATVPPTHLGHMHIYTTFKIEFRHPRSQAAV